MTRIGSLRSVALLFVAVACGPALGEHDGSPPAPSPGAPRQPSPADTSSAKEAAAARFAALRDALAARLASSGTPGGALAVVTDGQLFADGVGVRRQGQSEPVTRDTVFSVASVSKPVTATALMSLVQDGHWSLAAHPTTLIPELVVSGPWPASAMTTEQMLTHSSGYPNYADETYSPFSDPSPNAISSYLLQYQDLQLDFEPGSQFTYSNFGYAVLGLLAERLGQAPYAQVVGDRVLSPAGMATATFSHLEAQARDHAAPHMVVDGAVQTYPLYSTPFFEPFGGLYASVVDLAKFARVLFPMSGVLEDATTADMLSGRLGGFMGLGLFLEPSPAGVIASHSGSMGGFLTSLYVVPSARFAVAVCINSDWDESTTEEIARQALASYLGVQP